MRDDRGESRGLREVQIAIASVQEGKKRFPAYEEREAAEPAPWRNNLTALSQEHNLYFAAHKDQIHVYQPDFPSQHLTQRIFSWTVATSGNRAYGIFPRTESHWVNRVVLEYLGCEEVIATAHDDGDFIVCTLRSVRDAIRGVLYDGLPADKASARIRYLYRRNVGASAWGIAIHKEARLLAVSANSCRVTVFSPALCYTNKWHSAHDAPDRRTDQEVTLKGHQYNIPAVAFCNTGADPHGRYIVSTDIMGEVIIWDIWSACPVKQLKMSPATHLDEHYPGWSITCVDDRSFLSVDNEAELKGYVRESAIKPRGDSSHTLESLGFRSSSSHSPMANNLRSSLRGRTHAAIVEHEDAINTEGDPSASMDEEVYSDEVDEEFDPIELATDADVVAEMELAAEMGPGDWNPEEYFAWRFLAEGLVTDDFEDTDDWGIDFEGIAEVLSYDAVDFGPRPATDSDTTMEDTFLGRSEIRPPLRPPPVRQSRGSWTSHVRGRKRSAHLPIAPQPPGLSLPFSIIHTGQKVVTLLRSPFTTYADKCIDPCKDRTTLQARLLESFDRLNLTVHIPELSVVVLATQTGRAAVMSLTEMSSNVVTKSSPFPRNRRRGTSENSYSECDGKETDRYGIRLDCVLPLEQQESQHERPWAPLIGLAASPIQQTGKTGGKRRWRLMLTYRDNSVLSYELSRGGGEDNGVLVF